MGLFGKKSTWKPGIFAQLGVPQKLNANIMRPPDPETIDFSTLNVKNYFYPWTNEMQYFTDLAFPTFARPESQWADLNWRPAPLSNLEPTTVRQMLKDLQSGRISIHDLTKQIFGHDSYNDFIEFVDESLQTDRVRASDSSLTLLRTAKPSSEWFTQIKKGINDQFVKECLEDLGSRKSTHSSVGELWRIRTDQLDPYTEAGRIGFCTVKHILQPNNILTFNLRRTPEGADRWVGDSCSPIANSLWPLDAICKGARSVVDELVDQLDEDLKKLLGDTPTKHKIYFSSNPMPYRTTLMATAHAGAMMAAIAHDPSDCIHYEGIWPAKKRRPPSSALWYR